MSQFVADCNWHRKEIKRVAADVKKFLEQTKKDVRNSDPDGIEDTGEMIANITISYRHLEVSVYDKETTVGA